MWLFRERDLISRRKDLRLWPKGKWNVCDVKTDFFENTFTFVGVELWSVFVRWPQTFLILWRASELCELPLAQPVAAALKKAGPFQRTFVVLAKLLLAGFLGFPAGGPGLPIAFCSDMMNSWHISPCLSAWVECLQLRGGTEGPLGSRRTLGLCMDFFSDQKKLAERAQPVWLPTGWEHSSNVNRSTGMAPRKIYTSVKDKMCKIHLLNSPQIYEIYNGRQSRLSCKTSLNPFLMLSHFFLLFYLVNKFFNFF